MKHESNGDTNCNYCAWNNLQRINKGKKNEDIRKHVETIQTKKNPVDLRRLVVTQTSVRNHQLTLVWKNSQRSFDWENLQWKRQTWILLFLKAAQNNSSHHFLRSAHTQLFINIRTGIYAYVSARTHTHTHTHTHTYIYIYIYIHNSGMENATSSPS